MSSRLSNSTIEPERRAQLPSDYPNWIRTSIRSCSMWQALPHDLQMAPRVAFDLAVMEDLTGGRRAEAPRIAVHAPSPPERSRSLRGSFARMPSNKRRAQTNSPARIANPPITNGHPGMSGKNHPIRPSTSANTPTATIPIRITRWRSFGLCMETHCHIFVTKSELSHPEH